MFSFVCGVLEEIQVRRYLSEGEKAKNPLSVGVADGTVHVGGVCSQPASVAEGVTVYPRCILPGCNSIPTVLFSSRLL
jgi:hypothetical protein